AALAAVNQWDRTTPIALPRNPPVTQPPLHAAPAALGALELRGDGRDRLLRRQAAELLGVDQYSFLGVLGLPLVSDLCIGAAARAHHGADRQPVAARKLKVALIVRRHAHDRALAVAHQHVITDPDWNRLAAEGMAHVQSGRHAALLCG